MARESSRLPSHEAFRIAVRLLAEHGEDAEIVAALQVDGFSEAGKREVLAVWRGMLRALDELRLTAKTPADQVQ